MTISASGIAAIGVVDDPLRAEPFGVAGGIGDVVLMGEEDVPETAARASRARAPLNAGRRSSVAVGVLDQVYQRRTVT